MPDCLWEKVQASQKQGGIDAVQSKIRAFGEMQQLAQSLIDRVLCDMEQENLEDQSCRARFGSAWSRVPSQTLTSQFKSQIDSYTGKLKQAVDANHQILARLEANALPVADRLKMSREDLEAQIPTLKVEDESSVSAQKKVVVRQALDSLENAFKTAEAKKAELKQSASGASVGVDLLAAHLEHKLLSPVIQDAISSLQPQVTEFHQLLKETIPVDEVVQKAYDDFKIAVPNQVVEQSKANYLADLDRASTAVISCLADANDGAQFFQRLLEYLRIVQQQVTDFVYARTEEKTAHMSLVDRPGSRSPANTSVMAVGASVAPSLTTHNSGYAQSVHPPASQPQFSPSNASSVQGFPSVIAAPVAPAHTGSGMTFGDPAPSPNQTAFMAASQLADTNPSANYTGSPTASAPPYNPDVPRAP